MPSTNGSSSPSAEHTARKTPTGAIARVESGASHRAFVHMCRPDWISIKIKPHVQQLVKRGETAASWFGEGRNIITTSTVDDDDLGELTVSQEAALVERFDPDIHIAGDVSAYPRMSPEVRARLIRESMKNAIWLDRECSANARFVPIIKGPTVQEREICYRALNYFDHNLAAIYAVRYFTAGQGRNIYDLANDLHAVDRESNLNLMVLGTLSPQVVKKAPTSVVAVAGQNQWRKEVSLGDLDFHNATGVWEDLSEAVEEALEYSPTDDDLRRAD